MKKLEIDVYCRRCEGVCVGYWDFVELPKPTFKFVLKHIFKKLPQSGRVWRDETCPYCGGCGIQTMIISCLGYRETR